MTTIDPRLEERRREVAEDRARVDVRRVIWFVVLLASIGSALWLITSPMLSVQTISVFGVTNAQVSEVLEAEQVIEGRPLVAIRSDGVAEAIEEDPWVRSAAVELVFPSHVEVTVVERVGIAWVPMRTRWGLVADDGVLVRVAGEPIGGLPVIQIDGGETEVGTRVESLEILGSVLFLRSLDEELAAMSRVRISDGELWAFVGTRNVRLGDSDDMDAKAAALMAIMDSAPPGVINVIAPSRPAVEAEEPPEDGVEGEQEGESESFTDGSDDA